jgi:hypothetical protein
VSGSSASSAPAASILPDQIAAGSADAGGSRAPDIMGENFGAGASAGAKAAATDDNQLFARGEPSRDAAAVDPFQPRNLLFVAAIVLGLGLLVVSRLRSRPKA